MHGVTPTEGNWPMSLNTDHLLRTVATLDHALRAYENTPADETVLRDLYRNAAVKSFELSLETCSKWLRKALKLYVGDPRAVDALVFNDVLRHAGKHGLLDQAGVRRWLAYRANRNTTAHDYGEGFANGTLQLLPAYTKDIRELSGRLQELFDAQDR